MYQNNFCAECGERLARGGWRDLRRGRFCIECRRKVGWFTIIRPILMFAITAISAFAIGRYLRPAPPPLLIQRSANSPLSDLTVNLNTTPGTTIRRPNDATNQSAATLTAGDQLGYICGARTKKGTPCHRRVHVAGERCFQHKGMPSLVPLSKLVVRP